MLPTTLVSVDRKSSGTGREHLQEYGHVRHLVEHVVQVVDHFGGEGDVEHGFSHPGRDLLHAAVVVGGVHVHAVAGHSQSEETSFVRRHVTQIGLQTDPVQSHALEVFPVLCG